MSRQHLWTWCALAGLVAFAASFAFGHIPGLVACGPAPTSGGPIIAFEFVRSIADVAALFGSEPCRGTLVAAQRTGLLLDGLWFIPAYTAFLALAALAAGGRFAKPVVAIVLIAGLGDEIEGSLLWTILDSLPGMQPTINALWVDGASQVLLLGIATVGIGLQVLRIRRSLLTMGGGGAILGAGISTLFSLSQGNPAPMMQGFTIGWVGVLLVALAGAVRPSLFAGSAAPPRPPSTPAA